MRQTEDYSARGRGGMNGTYPILRSLDPYHARIGYLLALCSVALRDIDTTEGLRARLHTLLFERIYTDDPRFDELRGRVPPGRWDSLSRHMTRSIDEDPYSILSDAKGKEGWLYASEFWLNDACMPSPLGLVPEDKIDRIIDLGRWTGVLLPTLDLSERGFLLNHLLAVCRDQEDSTTFNPLNPRRRPAIQLLCIHIMLSSEMLFPFLLIELVERHDSGKQISTRGKHGLLRAAVDRMVSTIGEPEDPDVMFELRDVYDFGTSLRGNLSTEENYLRPRMEILIDLGLIGRKASSRQPRSFFAWVPNETTRRLVDVWRELAVGTSRIPQYLDEGFFSSLASVMKQSCQPVDRLEERLLWFVRAYQSIGREFGFSPGRTLSLLACLLAWEEGKVLEVSNIYLAVREAAGTTWSRYLHFSGGSRFDSEFLIRIDAEALEELEKKCADLAKRGGARK